MSPVALLWIALLQLLAPAGSMHPAPHMDARIVLVGQSSIDDACLRQSGPGSGATCTSGSRGQDASSVAGRRQGLDPAPLARSSGGPRRTTSTTRAGSAPVRAIRGSVVQDSRAPMVGAVSTAVDRTSRDVVAGGWLVVNLPIPPPVG